MQYLGSQTLETEHLILKSQTMKEQRRIWEILMMPEVNKYYLTVPVKFKSKLNDWSAQEKYYQEDMKHANDNDVFRWSIFLKSTGECIGRISCHKASDDYEFITNPNIRGVGWILDPKYQGLGYGKEAAKAMIDYMFCICDIDAVITGAAIENPASWKIMERLGFIRQEQTQMVQYTFLNQLIEDYQYIMTKERYLTTNNNKTKTKKP